MKVSVERSSAIEVKADLIAIPLAAAAAAATTTTVGKRVDDARLVLPRKLGPLDRAFAGVVSSALASGDFVGKAGERLVVYPPRADAGAGRGLLIGLGKSSEIDREQLRRAAAHAVSDANGKQIAHVAILAPRVRGLDHTEIATALAEGALLGSYRFDGYMSSSQGRPAMPRRVSLVFDELEGAAAVRRKVAEAVIATESQLLARDLSNEPPNQLSPSALARAARRVAREAGLACRVIRGAELERLGATALLAVGGGSVQAPCLIVLEHKGRPRGRKKGKPSAPICLVGKGITFDSGGLSLKPAANMGEMKHDMSGAAAVIGTLRAVGLMGLPQRVVGVIAAAENMPSGSAYRPGDIVRSMAGKTIEITNTDAEGRVVLADALHHACERYRPQVLIDLATLTGATMVALGPWATAALGNDDALIESLRRAGDQTGERVWPMPLLSEHRTAMKSSVADLLNSAGRDAGVSTAAAFLQEFVGTTAWVHLDIAGTGWTASRTPYHRGGATGVGVRLLLEWLRNRL